MKTPARERFRKIEISAKISPSSPGRSTLRTATIFILWCLVLFPEAGWAFQSHPAPEGLYVHQLAHGFFIVAMGILIYWLQVNDFVRLRGWRLIQVACILLILWNADAIVGHWVEERVASDAVIGEPDWTQRIILDSTMTRLYYMLKLDHIVSVPALICLFLGIRSLYKDALKEEARARD
jgi:lipid-A-disaccharide synthase-like uncharacterized protein